MLNEGDYRSYQARRIGDLVQEELFRQRGKVFNSFAHVCNLRLAKDRGLAILDKQVLLAPYHIQLAGSLNLQQELELAPGLEVYVEEEAVFFPARRIMVDLSRAEVWSSKLSAYQPGIEKFAGRRWRRFLRQKAQELMTYLQEKGHNQGFGGLNLLWHNLWNGIQLEMENYLLQRGYTHIRKMQQEGIDKDSLSKIVGLGPGLTPAGDDFITGWLSAEYFLQGGMRADSKEDNLLTGLIANLDEIDLFKVTTFVSSMQLKAAARGHFNKYLINFYGALLQNDSDLYDAVDTLLGVGSTSGTDILTGIIFGFISFSGLEDST